VAVFSVQRRSRPSYRLGSIPGASPEFAEKLSHLSSK
jgi:hypothetical protein